MIMYYFMPHECFDGMDLMNVPFLYKLASHFWTLVQYTCTLCLKKFNISLAITFDICESILMIFGGSVYEKINHLLIAYFLRNISAKKEPAPLVSNSLFWYKW